jgi:hypothetical protein
VGIIAHWVNSNFEPQKVLLSLQHMTGLHDGDAIASSLVAELSYYGLLHKGFNARPK